MPDESPEDPRLSAARRRIDAVETAILRAPPPADERVAVSRRLALSLMRDLRAVLDGDSAFTPEELEDLVSRLARGWSN